MKGLPDGMEISLGADGYVWFRAQDQSGPDPTDWGSEEARAAAKALAETAQAAKDGPSRRMRREPSGWFVLGDARAGDIVGAIGVHAVGPDGGACVWTASEAREFAAALRILADEDDAH